MAAFHSARLAAFDRPLTLSTKEAIFKAIFVSVLVASFCRSCYVGLQVGVKSRLGTYADMGLLIGDSWGCADDEIVTSIYAFKIRAKRAGLSVQEFHGFIRDVIKPILSDDQPDKLERVRKAIATVEAALPNDEKKPAG